MALQQIVARAGSGSGRDLVNQAGRQRCRLNRTTDARIYPIEECQMPETLE